MTKKEAVQENKTASKKMNEPQLILFEAVQENKTPNFIIIGALSKAGLLGKYREEESEYGVENIKPSITAKELDKIIKNYIG